jgi:hypothetical protein
MPCEDGPSQVVEAPPAGPTVIALTVGLRVVLAVLDDILRVAMRAGDPVGPAEVTDGLEALGIVDEVREVDHGARLGQQATGVGTRMESATHEDRIVGVMGGMWLSPRNPTGAKFFYNRERRRSC